MINFLYHTPTKVYFGRGYETQIGEILKEYGYSKILLHYGQGSIKKSGLYDKIISSLQEQDITFFELSGVEPNPKLSLVKTGASLCREKGIQLVLAVGGGSVIDSAKAIACASKIDFDPFLFNLKEREPEDALPVAVILTIAAAGSEMSASCVITDDERKLKRGFNSPFNRPLFAILNPELSYSVSPFQTACGIVDIMMHTLERYFTKTKDVDLTDRLSEGLLKSVMDAGKKAMEDPFDYEARGTLMWASSLSHNDLTGGGREVFMTCHQIAHEINGFYDNLSHGQILSVVFLSWANYMIPYAPNRFAQFAVRVFNCDMNFEHPKETAKEGIRRCSAFFKGIGMPITMEELDVDPALYPEMASKCTNRGNRNLNCYIPLGEKEILEILRWE